MNEEWLTNEWVSCNSCGEAVIHPGGKIRMLVCPTCAPNQPNEPGVVVAEPAYCGDRLGWLARHPEEQAGAFAQSEEDFARICFTEEEAQMRMAALREEVQMRMAQMAEVDLSFADVLRSEGYDPRYSANGLPLGERETLDNALAVIATGEGYAAGHISHEEMQERMAKLREGELA